MRISKIIDGLSNIYQTRKYIRTQIFPPQANEIRVISFGYNEQLFRFHGSWRDLAKRLDEMLGKPRETTANEIYYQGVLFTKRKDNNHIFWTFKTEHMRAVGRILGVKVDRTLLSVVKENEVKVICKDEQYGRIHGQPVVLANRLNRRLGLPENATSETKIYRGITFTLRFAGGDKFKRVWTFEPKDLEAVGRILGKEVDVAVLGEIKENEIGIRSYNLDRRFHRLHGSPLGLYSKLIEILGRPEDATKEENIINGIIFTRRRNDAHKVWTFKKADIKAVADLLGVKLDNEVVADIEEGEVRITKRDEVFSRLHGQNKHLVQILCSKLGKPEEATKARVKYRGVIFTLRYSYAQRVWTFKEKDLLAVARILGVKCDEVSLKKIAPTEIKITASEERLGQFHGGQQKIAPLLNELLGDPMEAVKEEQEKGGVTFTRRYVAEQGGNKSWAFEDNEKDKKAVSELLGIALDEVLLSKPGPHEIKIINTEKRWKQMVGDVAAIARFLNSDAGLGNPETEIQERKIWHGIVFTRRISGPTKIWVCDPEQVDLVEKMLIRLGIINKSRIYVWSDESRVSLAASGSRKMRDKIYHFDSGQERIVGLLLRHYALLDTFEPGVNMQVKANHHGRYKFDYVLRLGLNGRERKMVIEFHPDCFEEMKPEKNRTRYIDGIVALAEEQMSDLEKYQFNQLAVTWLWKKMQSIRGYGTAYDMDVYDYSRRILIQMTPEMGDAEYVRARDYKELFNKVIWPYYYRPLRSLTKRQAYHDYLGAIDKVIAKSLEFDRLILPIIFGEAAEDAA